jgi:aryl-alcohol dehydrogenase-like predicted oxidoreductase
MTFGTEWGWGAPRQTARAIFTRYLEAGGNFIDTADGYTGGTSEEMLGRFIKATKSRDRVVLATKFTFNRQEGNPNAGGNGRKNIYRVLHGCLRRLQTDYVDLFYLHAWDRITPLEEVLDTLDALVREGKVRYVGLSNVPAWYLARYQTIADLRGMSRVCALQLEYSLVERNIEREHVPAAIELGAGICPWSPLAGGLLSGKYRRGARGVQGGGRLKTMQGSGSPVFEKFTERNWRILDALLSAARALGRSPAQVALSWIARRPGVVSTIVGATRLDQLEDNLRALEFEIPAELSQKLEEASQPELLYPYLFFAPVLQSRIHGGMPTRREPLWYRGD